MYTNPSVNRKPYLHVGLYRPLRFRHTNRSNHCSHSSHASRCSRPHEFLSWKSNPLFEQYPVQNYLHVNGISLKTACKLGLNWTMRSFHRYQFGSRIPFPLTEPLPTVAFPYKVEGRLVGMAYCSCQFEYCEEDLPFTRANYCFSEDWDEVTNTPELPLPPFHIDCINPNLRQGQRVPLLLIANDELDVAALTEAGYPHCIGLKKRSYAEVVSQLAPFRAWFNLVDRIVVCIDRSLVNNDLIKALLPFFDRKIMFIEYPSDCWSVVDILLQHGADDLRGLIEFAEEEIKRAEAEEEERRKAAEQIPDDFWLAGLTEKNDPN